MRPCMILNKRCPGDEKDECFHGCLAMLPESNRPWDNEPKLQPGRPYDGAVIRDGQLVIPY